MRYVITYVNITKEKRYCYIIVILNIGPEQFGNRSVGVGVMSL